MVPTYSGILAIKRNKFESVLVRWMNLEPVIQSEVSQKEKNEYDILTIHSKSRKLVLMKLSAGQNRDADVENKFVDMAGAVGVEGEAGVN